MHRQSAWLRQLHRICVFFFCFSVSLLCAFHAFRWYSLKAKPGSKKADQNRGEIEVTATFLVQQIMSQSQSSLSIEKKTKKSLSVRNLAHSLSKGMLISCFFLFIYFICCLTSNDIIVIITAIIISAVVLLLSLILLILLILQLLV